MRRTKKRKEGKEAKEISELKELKNSVHIGKENVISAHRNMILYVEIIKEFTKFC